MNNTRSAWPPKPSPPTAKHTEAAMRMLLSARQFNYEGNVYLRGIDGVRVYDNDTHAEVGKLCMGIQLCLKSKSV